MPEKSKFYSDLIEDYRGYFREPINIVLLVVSAVVSAVYYIYLNYYYIDGLWNIPGAFIGTGAFLGFILNLWYFVRPIFRRIIGPFLVGILDFLRNVIKDISGAR
jgi:hypothetical protein